MSPRVTVLFPLSGRSTETIDREDTPLDFYYGALALREGGTAVAFADTRLDPPGVLRNIGLMYERLRNRMTDFGLSRQRVHAIASDIDSSDIAISFTDFFSLSLGRYRDVLRGSATLVGGFHGLTDIVDEVPPVFRSIVHRQTTQAVSRLDHLFFFGEADRVEAIRRYGIPEHKTSLFRFGIDTEFWTPDPEDGEAENVVLSVGSDNKRDYATLLAAPVEPALRIVTRLPIEPPAGRNDVEIIRGSYHNAAVTNAVLRSLYRRAKIVAVPIRDVFQPSGYSVTLQAMACGRPVILSRIKGLWDPEVFVSGENCMLVEPENPDALAQAVRLLAQDDGLRNRIATAARETAVSHFALKRMNESLQELVERTGAL